MSGMSGPSSQHSAMRHRLRARMVGAMAALAVLLPAAGTQAHNGVELEADTCVMRLGRLRIHVTGYEPGQPDPGEYCHDLPVAGRTFLVLDFVDAALREQLLEFRLLRDDSGLGRRATVHALGGEAGLDTSTLAALPRQRFSSGTARFEFPFEEAGRFLLVARGTDPQTGQPLEAVFPLVVGGGTGLAPIAAGIVLLAVVAVAGYNWRRLRQQPAAG